MIDNFTIHKSIIYYVVIFILTQCKIISSWFNITRRPNFVLKILDQDSYIKMIGRMINRDSLRKTCCQHLYIDIDGVL